MTATKKLQNPRFYFVLSLVTFWGYILLEYATLRQNSSLIGLYNHTTSDPWYFWSYSLLTIFSSILFCVVSIWTVFRWQQNGLNIKSLFAGGLGSFVGIITSSCPVCGSTLLSAIGIAGSLYSLPFQGLELKIISLFLLLLSLYWLVSKKNPFGNKIKSPSCGIRREIEFGTKKTLILLFLLFIFLSIGYNLLRTDPIFDKDFVINTSCQNQKL